jgi:lysozyme family protein
MAQIVFFDWAMNSPASAVRAAQRITEKEGDRLFGEGFEVDGMMGPKTVAAINKFVLDRGPEEFVRQFNESRRSFYKKARIRTGQQEKFRQGWLNRIDDLEAYMVSRPFPGRAGASLLDEGLLRTLTSAPAGTMQESNLEDIVYDSGGI